MLPNLSPGVSRLPTLPTPQRSCQIYVDTLLFSIGGLMVNAYGGLARGDWFISQYQTLESLFCLPFYTACS